MSVMVSLTRFMSTREGNVTGESSKAIGRPKEGRTEVRAHLDTPLHFDFCSADDFPNDLDKGNIDTRILQSRST